MDSDEKEEKAICEVGGGGLVLPLYGDSEQEWPKTLRAILYLLGLAWCFMGVAIISDVFMSGIEKVTSKKLRLWDKKKGRFYTYEVWNATVANLTLMALGSSAPEILLNVIDIFAKEFYLEGLGPSTIVGSAAFNLLMIIAVCIVAIPDGEVRYIKDVPVYACTATWSIFAYVWLLFILVVITPNVVEVWEGVLTFLFFPLLVSMAWVLDKGLLFGTPDPDHHALRVHEEMTPDEFAEAEAQVRHDHGEHLSAEQVARIIAATDASHKSRAHYRVIATRAMFGGRRVSKEYTMQNKFKSLTKSLTTSLKFPLGSSGSAKKAKVCPIEVEDHTADVYISFVCEKYAVLESAGEATVKVIREGDPTLPCRVWYDTSDGTAKDGKDYQGQHGWLELKASQSSATITIKVIDDAAYEEDEEFYITLSKPQVVQGDSEIQQVLRASLGEKSKVKVTIIDDDDPGIIGFENDVLSVPSKHQDFEAPILVQRRNGSCGEVTVKYKVEGDTALPGRDFEAKEGVLKFEDKQVEAYIKVLVKAIPRYDTRDCFRIVLSEPTGNSKLDPKRDGAPERNVASVWIEASMDDKERVDKIRSILQDRWAKSKVGHANWATQFKDAIFVNGGDSDEDEVNRASPSIWDYVSHTITLPWKLLFALVPPTDYCGGWLCFYSALVMIGLVTMIIGDMASLLGCVLDIPDEITAITLVALGTSLPDTFASKTAATQDEHADASVGNVTGSNSVNVFLGLGLPWMIASIYWIGAAPQAQWDRRYQFLDNLDGLGPPGARKQVFVVEAGSLSFSVIVFTGCALLCLLLLYFRRRTFGGELGGPKGAKYISAAALSCMWFFYIVLSSWKMLQED